MPPKDRPGWAQINPTVSPEVATALRIRAAELGVGVGTAAEAILWDALVKPDDAHLAQTGFTEEQIERIYAEEVLAVLGKEQNPVTIAQTLSLSLELDEDPAVNVKLVRKEIGNWRHMRRIPRRYRGATFNMLALRGMVPRILEKGLVEEDWFNVPMEEGED